MTKLSGPTTASSSRVICSTNVLMMMSTTMLLLTMTKAKTARSTATMAATQSSMVKMLRGHSTTSGSNGSDVVDGVGLWSGASSTIPRWLTDDTCEPFPDFLDEIGCTNTLVTETTEKIREQFCGDDDADSGDIGCLFYEAFMEPAVDKVAEGLTDPAFCIGNFLGSEIDGTADDNEAFEKMGCPDLPITFEGERYGLVGFAFETEDSEDETKEPQTCNVFQFGPSCGDEFFMVLSLNSDVFEVFGSESAITKALEESNISEMTLGISTAGALVVEKFRLYTNHGEQEREFNAHIQASLGFSYDIPNVEYM